MIDCRHVRRDCVGLEDQALSMIHEAYGLIRGFPELPQALPIGLPQEYLPLYEHVQGSVA